LSESREGELHCCDAREELKCRIAKKGVIHPREHTRMKKAQEEKRDLTMNRKAANQQKFEKRRKWDGGRNIQRRGKTK